jgi:uncharacterized membrane protein
MSNSKRNISKTNHPPGSVGIMTASTFQGPLPSPEALRGFEDVLPGAAERIIAMAEKEQEARLKTDKKIITANIAMMTLGILAALISLFVISFLIKYSIDKGYPNIAAILSSTSLVGVVGLFVWFRKKKKDG